MQNFIGRRFGRLTVIAFAEQRGKHRLWRCRCDCGVNKIVFGTNLTRMKSMSCGCLNAEKIAKRNRDNKKHGQSGNGTSGTYATPEYNAWLSMIKRCANRRHKSFANYGGRGIKVCKRWMTFANFFNDMGSRPSANHSLDRIDNNGDYEPKNCRWATTETQGRNRRTTKMLTHLGDTASVTEWAGRIGVNRHTIFSRLRKGLPVEQVLAPLRK